MSGAVPGGVSVVWLACAACACRCVVVLLVPSHVFPMCCHSRSRVRRAVDCNHQPPGSHLPLSTVGFPPTSRVAIDARVVQRCGVPRHAAAPRISAITRLQTCLQSSIAPLIPPCHHAIHCMRPHPNTAFQAGFQAFSDPHAVACVGSHVNIPRICPRAFSQSPPRFVVLHIPSPPRVSGSAGLVDPVRPFVAPSPFVPDYPCVRLGVRPCAPSPSSTASLGAGAR